MAAFGDLATSIEPFAGLVRDHLYVHGLVTAAREALAGAGEQPSPATATDALERLRDLAAYLDDDLPVHIAKEELVLFPALRDLDAAMPRIVDEMVEQHDEVRLRAANVASALAAIEATHLEVEAATQRVSALAAAANTAPDGLAEMLDAVKRLDWILEGHFGDEEDDLFAPALALLPADVCARLARDAAALDR